MSFRSILLLPSLFMLAFTYAASTRESFFSSISKSDWPKLVELLKSRPKDLPEASEIVDSLNPIWTQGTKELVLELEKSYPGILQQKDSVFQALPIHWASKSGRSEIVQAIVDLYPNRTLDTDRFGSNALHYALSGNTNPATIKLLYQLSPELSQKRDNNGHLPIFIAASQLTGENMYTAIELDPDGILDNLELVAPLEHALYGRTYPQIFSDLKRMSPTIQKSSKPFPKNFSFFQAFAIRPIPESLRSLGSTSALEMFARLNNDIDQNQLSLRRLAWSQYFALLGIHERGSEILKSDKWNPYMGEILEAYLQTAARSTTVTQNIESKTLMPNYHTFFARLFAEQSHKQKNPKIEEASIVHVIFQQIHETKLRLASTPDDKALRSKIDVLKALVERLKEEAEFKKIVSHLEDAQTKGKSKIIEDGNSIYLSFLEGDIKKTPESEPVSSPHSNE